MKNVKETTVYTVILFLLTFLPSIASAQVPNFGLKWPVKNKGVEDTSLFFGVDDSVTEGLRQCSNGGFVTHLGIDLNTNKNEQVYAIADGKVVKIGNDSNWGGYIVLSHNNNTWTSVYWHVTPTVKKYDTVYKGQFLGNVYDTSHLGDVSHIHLGMRKGAYNPSHSTNGYGNCSRNLRSFVNPYNHLPNAKHFIGDNMSHASFTNESNWVTSSQTYFYYGSNYHLLAGGKNESATFNFKFEAYHNYKVYARVPIDTNRTTSAKYEIYINGYKFKTKYIDQTDFAYKAKSIYLTDMIVTSGTKVKIKVSNARNSGWLAVDAILFVDK